MKERRCSTERCGVGGHSSLQNTCMSDQLQSYKVQLRLVRKYQVVHTRNQPQVN